MKNILLHVINSYDTFALEDNPSVSEVSKENTYSENMRKIYYLDNLQDLNNLFVNNRYKVPTSEKLYGFETSTFANVLNYLVRDPLTMQFNKSYLVNHLLEDEKQNFKALIISSAFVKISNTLNSSHSSTDKQIEKIENEVYSFLNEKINFNQDPFSNTPMNYMISLDGGDMLLALNPNTDLNVDDIKDFLNEKNLKHYSHDNLLRVTIANSFQNLNSRNFEKVLSSQVQECNKNKFPLINNLLKDDIIANLLNVTLKDTMLFYKSLVSNPRDISAKTKYIDLISKIILNLYSSLDVVHEDIKPQSAFSKFTSKISTIFKKKQPTFLPVVNLENSGSTVHAHTISSFVPKSEIDYSKIKYNQNKVLDNEKNIKCR